MDEVKTTNEFNKLVEVGPVVVDFFATWCGPCHALAPIFEQVAEKNPNITFVKCNIDEAGEVASKHNISAIPCLLFFKDGHVAKSLAGIQSKDKLQEVVETIYLTSHNNEKG